MSHTSAPVPSYPDLAGKVAVVTGGSRGIGAATAQALAANGVAVALVSRDQAAADLAAKTIQSQGGRAVGVAADCTVEADLARLRDQVHDELGPVGILMALAGGNGTPVASADETAAHWRQVIDGDLTATYLSISALLADLTERRGAIVTMSSSAARQASYTSAAYAAAKAGVIGLTRHLAGELASQGVRVNCLCPATVENDRIRAYLSPEARKGLDASIPLGRIGQPADVASAAVYLVSQASAWLTGVTLDVAGGKVMS